MKDIQKELEKLNKEIGERMAKIERNEKEYGEELAETINKYLREEIETRENKIKILNQAEEILLGIYK